MKLAGRRSWQLSIGDDAYLTTALVVRDATGIVVPHDADGSTLVDVPPPLLVSPPRTTTLSLDERVAVGPGWLTWYRALVDLTVHDHRNPSPPGTGQEWERWAQDRFSAHDALGARPEFTGLADRPTLQRVAVEVFREPPSVDRSVALAEPMDHASWRRHQSIVDEIVAQRGLDPGDLNGAIVLVPVIGTWWHLAAPGFVLASGGAYGDDDLGPQLVRTALETSVPL